MSRIGWIFVGLVLAIVLLIAGGYLFISTGVVSMAASASPLPLEKRIAHLAVHASARRLAEEKDPLALNDTNLAAGAAVYHDSCAMCHGAPGQPRPPIAAGMFPDPPQLFSPDDMVTDDPEGETYWKITNGIRLSGMPAFAKSLSDAQRWQVTMLVAHADKLPAAAETVLARGQ
jgi:thiosulfate dehydrogenase